MITRLLAGVIFLVLGSAVVATAQLDLDQEVLIIPDTHNEKPYIWHAKRNPEGYGLVLSENKGQEAEYSFRVITPSGIRPEKVHVFMTDDDLHTYVHRMAKRVGEDYRFMYEAPGRYRMEVVFETPQGWVNLRKSIKIGRRAKTGPDNKLPGDEDYQVKLKLIPKKAYAEHVVTLLYEILYMGAPVKDLEKIDGRDMQSAAWDEDLREFVYATPKQSLGGPQVAISFVFMRSGRHAIFSEFRHKGVVRRIDSVISVYEESGHDSRAVENLRPAD